MNVRLTTLVAIAVGALPSSAASAQSISPPGFSSFSQYREAVPTASGSVPSVGRGGLAPVPQSGQSPGDSAKALARFVAESRPAAGNSRSAAAPAVVSGAPGLAGAGGASVLGSVAAGARGAGGGLGLALPLILGAGVLVALAGLLWRRRARS